MLPMVWVLAEGEGLPGRDPPGQRCQPCSAGFGPAGSARDGVDQLPRSVAQQQVSNEGAQRRGLCVDVRCIDTVCAADQTDPWARLQRASVGRSWPVRPLWMTPGRWLDLSGGTFGR